MISEHGTEHKSHSFKARTDRTRYPLSIVKTMVLLVTVHTERDKKSPRFLQRNVFVYVCDIAAEFVSMLFLGNFIVYHFTFGSVNVPNTDKTPGDFTFGVNTKRNLSLRISPPFCVFGPLGRPHTTRY